MDGPPYNSEEHRRQAIILTLALAAGFTLWSNLVLDRSGVDLLPIWLAAKFWASGQPELIYTIEGNAFTLSTPEAWRALATAEGIGNIDVNPFIYAPLWAVLIAPLTDLISFASFNNVVSILNPATLSLIPWLVWRAAPVAPPAMIIGIGFAMLAFTTVGLLPIMGGQVQILVAFLLALTMERSRNHAPMAAGAALGLAAAMKLYPALFVVLFIATRQPRAIVSFGVVGGALGLASVAFAGWPLHAELLHELSVISASIIQINLSTNLDILILLFLGWEMTDGLPGRAVLIKPDTWVLLSRAAMLGFIAGLTLLGRYRRTVAMHPLFWPLAVVGTALLGPLSWTFHYILPMAAAGLLVTLMPRNLAVITLVSVGIVTSILPIGLPFPTIGNTPPLQLWGSFGFLSLTLVYSALVLRAARSGK